MHLLTDIARGYLVAAVIAAAIAFILIFAGVVLPAVWSRERSRRDAAVVVLQKILRYAARRGRRHAPPPRRKPVRRPR